MEQLQVKLNGVDRFDGVLRDSLPDGGDLEIVTKDAGTVTGRGLVMLTFTVELPNGQLKRAQTVTSMRMFRAIANAIVTSYDDEGFRVNMVDPLDDGIIIGEKE